MECTLCKKQYVGKSETNFNIRLNNHGKDVKKTDAILACRHFQEKTRFQQTCKVHHYRYTYKYFQIKRHFMSKID